jgi:hypothetical protein
MRLFAPLTAALGGLLLFLPLGCVAPEDVDVDMSESSEPSDNDFHGEEGKADGEGTTVGDFVRTACATSVVLGLARQIADEVNCLNPGALESFEEGDGIVFVGSAVLPYLDPEAVDHLKAAARAAGELRITSAYRTVPQQYLLYRWHQLGRCGIAGANPPGESNHESGRAVDLSNWSDVVRTMKSNSWSHPYSNDPVHFDHTSSPDIRGRDVRAFQRLWNRNHPDDQIAEDGDYGDNTASRLIKSPAAGFATGASCQ